MRNKDYASFPGSAKTLIRTDHEKSQIDSVTQGAPTDQLNVLVGMQYYLPHIHWLCTGVKPQMVEAKKHRDKIQNDIAQVKELMQDLVVQFREVRLAGQERYSGEVRRVHEMVSFDHSIRYLNGVKLL